MVKMLNLMLCIFYHNTIFFPSHENVPSHRFKVPGKLSPWLNVTLPLPQGNADQIRLESTYPIFRYFQGREPMTLLGNLFQCLKTPDILGTRPFLLHLKLIFPWSVSALSGHGLVTHSEALVTPSFSTRAEGTQ